MNEFNNRLERAEKEIVVKMFYIQFAANLLFKFWFKTMRTIVWLHGITPIRRQNWISPNKRLNI
jgi:hypothetical protein